MVSLTSSCEVSKAMDVKASPRVAQNKHWLNGSRASISYLCVISLNEDDGLTCSQ